MLKQIILCDCCGKDITNTPYNNRTPAIIKLDAEGFNHTGKYWEHVCRDCVKELASVIKVTVEELGNKP